MQLRHISWASVRRRKGRFAFLLVALTLGIGTVVALLSLSAAMRTAVGDDLDRFGANIILTPRARSLDLVYGGLAAGGLTVDAHSLTTDDVARIRTIPNRRNLSAVAPKLVGTIEVSGTQLLLVGADLRQERIIKNWWRVDGRFATTPEELMIGGEAARALGTRPGDTIDLGDGPRRVVGVIGETGALEDQSVFAELGVAQKRLAAPGAVTFVEVSALCSGCPIEDMVAQIAEVVPQARVSPLRQSVAAKERAVLQFTRFAYAVSAVVLLVAALVVTTTMMASVTERTQEIGILRAVGFRRMQIVRVVLLEALGVNVVGGLLGWVVGSLTARLVGPAFTEIVTPAAADARLAAVAVALAIVLGAGGGLYPALRASRMDPSHALRHI